MKQKICSSKEGGNVHMKRMFKSKYSVIISLLSGYFLVFIISNFSFIEVNFTQDMLRELISIVIGSLSSVIGIVISVYILAFSLFEKNYSQIAYSKFVNSVELFNYFQLCIFTIIVMINANFLLNDSISNISINMIGYGIILYILCLILIYPTMKHLIADSKSNKHIEELLKKLNEQTAYEYLKSQEIEKLSNNPFYKLSIVFSNLVSSNEKIIISNILKKCTQLIKEKISSVNGNEANQCRDYINSYVKLYKIFRKYSYDMNQPWIMNELLGEYIKVRKYGVENKIPHFDFVEYEEFINDTCLKYISNNEIELTRRYLYFLFDFLKYNIEYNLPHEDDLLIFHHRKRIKEKYDHLKSAQWDYISRNILSRIEEISNLAIKKGELDLYPTIIILFNTLFSDILDNSKLSKNQKRQLIIFSSYQLSRFIKKVIKEHKDYKFLSIYHEFTIKKSYEVHEELFTVLFSDFIQLLPYLAANKRLDNYILNKYGTLGRSIAEYVNKGEIIELAIKKLVKSLVSTGKLFIDTINLYSLTMYVETYKQAESIVIWVKDNKPKNKQLLFELEEILASMNQYESIVEMLNDENLYFEILLGDNN
jgi:uncharacterized integral membrane protein